MTLQALTYIVVGLSFVLYIGIAIWSRAHNTGDFYIAGRAYRRSPMEWQRRPTG